MKNNFPLILFFFQSISLALFEIFKFEFYSKTKFQTKRTHFLFIQLIKKKKKNSHNQTQVSRIPIVFLPFLQKQIQVIHDSDIITCKRSIKYITDLGSPDSLRVIKSREWSRCFDR